MKSILPICAICLSVMTAHAEGPYFRNSDTVYHTESIVVLDSSFGKLAGSRATVQETRSVDYLTNLNYLFKSVLTRREYENIEGSRCRLTVLAYERDGQQLHSSWEVTNHDCEARIDQTNSFLVTVQSGCCGAEEVFSYFTMAQGALLVKGTSPAIRIPNSQYFVVYYGANGMTYDKTHKSKIGILYLLNETRVLDQLRVTELKGPPWTPDIRGDFAEDYQKPNKKVELNFEEDTLWVDVVNNRLTIPKQCARSFAR